MQARSSPLALACVLAFATIPAYAQTPGASYTIWGAVLLPDGKPAARAIVNLYNDIGYSQEVSADESGRFEITMVPRGRFYLRASNPDDREQYSDPVPVDVSRALSNRVFFNLPLRSSGSSPSVEPKRGAAGITVSEASQRVPKQARREFEKGLALRAQGKLGAAVEAFDAAIRVFPLYFQAMADRGHTKIALHRVTEAELDFARALKLSGGFEPALRGAGLCAFDSGNYEAAAAYLEKALLQDPRNASSTLFLGIALSLLNRPEQARPALNKALQLDSRGSARAHVHLAYILLNENRREEAIEHLDAYMEKVPNAPDGDTFRELRKTLESETRELRKEPTAP